MKDESKAKWPEKMIGTRIVDDDGRRVYIICGQGTHDVSVWSEDTDTIEARAKQVRALPEMVMQLVETVAVLSTTNHNCSYRADCQCCALLKSARNILRDIGEVE